MSEAQLACVIIFSPLIIGTLIAALVETFNTHRRLMRPLTGSKRS